MDFGKLIGDAFAYAKEGLVGNIGIWVMLLILTIIPVIPIIGWIIYMAFTMAGTPDLITLAAGFGIAIILAVILSAFYSGYTMKILRGDNPLPAVTGFGKLFADGIRYMVIQFIYMIPAIAVFCVTVLPAFLTLMTSAIADERYEPGFEVIMGMMGGILITVIVAFILGLFALVGVVRFARTGAMGEAFNFSAILATIGRIGWGTYILALIIMTILVFIVSLVLGMIPIIGGILSFIFGPFIGVFTMRYVYLLYDSAGTA